MGSINIGATYTFCPLPGKTIEDFMKEHPGVSINLTCRSMEQLMQMLEAGELDTVKDNPDFCAIDIDRKETEMVGSYHLLKGQYIKVATRAFLKCLIENNAFMISMGPYGIGLSPSQRTSQVPSFGNPGFGSSQPSHPAHIIPTASSRPPLPGRYILRRSVR